MRSRNETSAAGEIDSKDRPYPRKPPTKIIDFVMLGLAVVSVLLLAWITFFDVPDDLVHKVIIADYIVCAIFAVEFAYRWRKSGETWKFPVRYWYEVLGMIPVSDPAFRSFRLLRIIVVLARLGRTADRAFGARITGALVDRFVVTIVDVIKRPITVAMLDEVAGVLQAGHYTANIARALEENRSELDAMILEQIKRDPQAGRFKFLPFHDDIINIAADTTFRILLATLADPRTDELVSDMIRENLDQIRDAVKQGHDKEESVAESTTLTKPTGNLDFAR
ncbi:ion transporter [Antrihabitans sp. YC2-6]|uniref:ion transporter n=1 Tax=Antrihabitans sp. YC2-6 TaxID=2799498 RepID=UPI0018F5C2AA|nr:ion transporter [Antrihabitans sp. YC2-6]MBJ8346091.1 ion transporter [Antrihabitans sp. YC2-6]